MDSLHTHYYFVGYYDCIIHTGHIIASVSAFAIAVAWMVNPMGLYDMLAMPVADAAASSTLLTASATAWLTCLGRFAGCVQCSVCQCVCMYIFYSHISFMYHIIIVAMIEILLLHLDPGMPRRGNYNDTELLALLLLPCLVVIMDDIFYQRGTLPCGVRRLLPRR